MPPVDPKAGLPEAIHAINNLMMAMDVLFKQIQALDARIKTAEAAVKKQRADLETFVNDVVLKHYRLGGSGDMAVYREDLERWLDGYKKG